MYIAVSLYNITENRVKTRISMCMLPSHYTLLHYYGMVLPPSPQAYQQYQDAKYINNYIDDYGVDDELSAVEEPFGGTFSRLMDISCIVSADEEQTPNAAAFEAACSERIQQFDDSESDDDDV